MTFVKGQAKPAGLYKNKDMPLAVRMQAANSILNFERPRLSQVEVQHRSLDKLSDEEFFRAWDALEAFLEQHGQLTLEGSDGGTARRSILAVCALMTSYNLVDCSTGRTAGFAPLTQQLQSSLPAQMRTAPFGHRASLDLGSARPTLPTASSVSRPLLNQ